MVRNTGRVRIPWGSNLFIAGSRDGRVPTYLRDVDGTVDRRRENFCTLGKIVFENVYK